MTWEKLSVDISAKDQEMVAKEDLAAIYAALVLQKETLAKRRQRGFQKRTKARSVKVKTSCGDATFVRGSIISRMKIPEKALANFLAQKNPNMARKYQREPRPSSKKGNIASRTSRAKKLLAAGFLEAKLHRLKQDIAEAKEWIRRLREN